MDPFFFFKLRLNLQKTGSIFANFALYILSARLFVFKELFGSDPRLFYKRVMSAIYNTVWGYVLAVCMLLGGRFAMAQSEAEQTATSYSLSGFWDLYYGYDFNLPEGRARQPFLYNHNRHHAVQLNLGLMSLGFEHARYRGSLSLQIGTYAADNYAEEPGLLKHLFDAYLGVFLNSRRSLALDLGVLPSHIGFESAVSSQNFTLTRSLLAENSPYYLSGAQLQYNVGNWELAGLILNGWQRIRVRQDHILPSLGTRATYTSRRGTVWNWSTFVGSNDPDTSRRVRYFSNFYSVMPVKTWFAFIAGLDIGMQQKSPNALSYQGWMSPVIMGQFALNPRWKMAFRMEHYTDPESVIIAPINSYAFNATGYSLNLDYTLRKQVLLRLEGRYLSGADPIYAYPSGYRTQHFFLVTSLSVEIPGKQK